jgi:hypothetical protein
MLEVIDVSNSLICGLIMTVFWSWWQINGIYMSKDLPCLFSARNSST